MTDFSQIETPCLILDTDRLAQNAKRMLAHCAQAGVSLRPHFKTPKSIDVALVATGGRRSGMTVSTLKEAEELASAGFDDLLFAQGITPNKFARVRRITEETGKTVTVVVDSEVMAKAVARELPGVPCLAEIDSGEHRGGIGATDPEVLAIARALGGQFRGIMTHAGHSYATDQISGVKAVAAEEVGAARSAAAMLRDKGITVEVVSIGSTPTVLHADDLEEITEVRAGIYLLWDLAQLSRGMCSVEDIALSVLACVIGHNRAAGVLTVDAGALALSKDIGAQKFMPEAGFGLLCDPESMTMTGLRVDAVHQEHGTVAVREPSDFDRHPIGSMVRILPNHACTTAAGGYGFFRTLDGQIWPRVDGW